MTFFLRATGVTESGDYVHSASAAYDHVDYHFAMQVQRRHKGALRAGGFCHGEETPSCVVECDGGGVTLERLGAKSLTLRLMDTGIQMHGNCDDEQAVWVKPGADDKAFRLDKVADAQCKALERSELGR